MRAAGRVQSEIGQQHLEVPRVEHGTFPDVELMAPSKGRIGGEGEQGVEGRHELRHADADLVRRTVIDEACAVELLEELTEHRGCRIGKDLPVAQPQRSLDEPKPSDITERLAVRAPSLAVADAILERIVPCQVGQPGRTRRHEPSIYFRNDTLCVLAYLRTRAIEQFPDGVVERLSGARANGRRVRAAAGGRPQRMAAGRP